MDIYSQNSRWKIYLAVVGIAIVLISIGYTSYLARRLAVIEQNNARFYAMAQEDLSEPDPELDEYCDITLQREILTANTTIPVIIVNEAGGIDWAVNFGEEYDTDTAYLQQQLADFRQSGQPPIPSAFGTTIYFGESRILQQLRYFPFVQFMLIGAFILFGYLGFNSARRAEQNRVWVGMAKETAHQLGTPISAIVAWVEHLKLMREQDEEMQEVVSELRNDVQRLELIADRFSKIGSAPKLEVVNVYRELDKCRAYMEKRAPRRVTFDFPAAAAGQALIAINPPLFDWVIENLLRNALDAMEGRGEISAIIYEDGDNVYIDVSDTGKGIPANRFKSVFRPGYTTKKRGWGLGLSLARRIIVEYHRGQIYVKRSEEGRGTTFTISLPRASDQLTPPLAQPMAEHG